MCADGHASAVGRADAQETPGPARVAATPAPAAATVVGFWPGRTPWKPKVRRRDGIPVDDGLEPGKFRVVVIGSDELVADDRRRRRRRDREQQQVTTTNRCLASLTVGRRFSPVEYAGNSPPPFECANGVPNPKPRTETDRRRLELRP